MSESMIEQCVAQVDISALSFTGISDQYFAITKSVIDHQRLEEIYFLYKLIRIYSDFGNAVEVNANEDSCRKDIEMLCKTAIETMVTLTNLAEDHQCSIPGCREGFIMADGIEKVRP